MKKDESNIITPSLDPWSRLRAATTARIGLGRSGNAIPVKSVLEFQHAHASARDAVHKPLDVGALKSELAPLQVLRVASEAPDRRTYLTRPDLGRQLSDETASELDKAGRPYDIAFVIGDGLSATAVQMHAAPLVHACLERLSGFKVAPVVVATQARVALGDDVGERLDARLVAMLIGERPGLSVAESLGVYLTFGPRRGRRDHERNCISNIHGKGGLTYEQAAAKLVWLANAALSLGLTGVNLKDDMGSGDTIDSDATSKLEAIAGR